MYADDLLLLSLSVTDLQLMVNLCASEFACIGLSINVKKSACISIGVRHKLSPFKIRADNADIDWKQEISFLGLTITASNTFKCNLQKIRHKFYRALNGLFGKIGLNSPTSVTLSLVNTFCLPILMYGLEALSLTKAMTLQMEKAYLSIFHKIFGSYDQKVINECLYFSGFLPFAKLAHLRRMKFLNKMKNNDNSALRLLYWTTGFKEVNMLANMHNNLISHDVNSWQTFMFNNFALSLSI